MYVTLFLLIIQLIMVPFCEWYGVTHAESHLMCTVEVHDVARAQPMPGHSTGTLRLRVASYPGPAQLLRLQYGNAEVTRGPGGTPSENFGIFELPRSILRLL